MKPHILVLLSIWIFTCVAPSIITLLDDSEKSTIVMNLNEEEQQEQGKKDIDEKHIVQNDISKSSFWFHRKVITTNDFCLIGNSSNTLEVILPPPEYIS